MRTDAPQPDIEEIAPDEELLRVDETAAIMVRPDGYYWQAEGSQHSSGQVNDKGSIHGGPFVEGSDG